MNSSVCPVAQGFLACTAPLLPHLSEEAALWSAAVDCFGQAVPAAVESARARHIIEYALKTCLPRAFDMFRLPLGRDVLGGLPGLDAENFPAVQHALEKLRQHKWDSGYGGETLLRESVLQPLEAVQKAVSHFASGRNAEACATLEPVIERLSATEELTPTLAGLLRISPAYPDGQPAFTPAAPRGLSFGTAT